MNRTPREPLTSEEAALAARLPPLHGNVEPGAMLDARILAAARAVVKPQPAPGLRIRLIAPLAVAASLSLAAGLAWRLRPPVAPIAHVETTTAAMEKMPEARMMTPPNQAAAPPSPPAAPPTPQSQAVAKPAVDASVAAEQSQTTAPPASPPAPPPPPAAATVETATADVAATPAVAPAPSPPIAKSVAAMEGTRDRATAAGAAQGTQANEAQSAAAASSVESLARDDGFGEDVPPATVDSPEVRQAWLRRIVELVQEGRVDDAKASLAEFRRRYPDAPLPPELRALEP